MQLIAIFIVVFFITLALLIMIMKYTRLTGNMWHSKAFFTASRQLKGTYDVRPLFTLSTCCNSFSGESEVPFICKCDPASSSNLQWDGVILL